MDQKHLEHIAELRAVEEGIAWYGWGSPVGLSIFFWTLVGIAAVIKIVFFG
jgi:hypothetical protein